MRIFKAEVWNLDLLLPLFEQYRNHLGSPANPERARIFLSNRIRFSESIIFLVLDEQERAIGFAQLYPHWSSVQLSRYWQLSDIFVAPDVSEADTLTLLLSKCREFVKFTQSQRLALNAMSTQRTFWESLGFKLDSTRQRFELRV
ncbi:GNAT family N-acetyltransferase [Pasteurellaceae bacterium HPA106]|uniref:GNAT family N-acetyltransferase n=1 Tax=Spirabiliibacterium pneumoniae TaxID=221400 RepID=UPI001AACD42E|nr:GNAT family N-acetyltransferase [Spirabiliibacterium pneumoniae]MBE2897062.1 GNAT family N-acetyltransferase [Spirabiliibacterium pneumoniae]